MVISEQDIRLARSAMRVDPLETLRLLGGYYKCPKHYDSPQDEEGRRLGPLVGYAGRDDQGRQLVGNIYANVAVLEEYPQIIDLMIRLDNFRKIAGEIARYDLKPTVLCAAPLGGMTIGPFVAANLDLRYIYAEKKVVALATADSREKANLTFGRHKPESGDRVIICEDVCNNFSTTMELITLIESCGATVIGIFCFLNRSLNHDLVYTMPTGLTIPLWSIVRKPIAEYRQDDLAVAADIAAGNVVWKPKDEWPRLMEAMKAQTA